MTFVMTYDKRNRSNLDKLAPNTRAAAYKWYEKCIELRADILIYETLRTLETQKIYLARGATKTLKSYHLKGQALDVVPIINGKDEWSRSAYLQEPYASAIAYAKQLGFEWGGDWKDFVDHPHLQFNYKGYGTDTVLEVATATCESGIIATVRVKVDVLNIRAGNGTQYPVIAKAYKGELYNVTGNLDDWHKIILANNDHRDAWVYGNKGEYLELV
ncbi:M15 family metallopeptidase [Ectobacillus sp. JY-23]|uniref:M15 family metallopeptidase n=1 Tax=Ectobacillus sp. JY-23 TaxID=2933872 RepID=UPI001FF419D3|nr:M15 family metallopeptidase [Ectobacillus sp. JY-23]UOY92909.1 M15 family metallopeptidase [Ectobacillus sp. JY-23]